MESWRAFVLRIQAWATTWWVRYKGWLKWVVVTVIASLTAVAVLFLPPLPSTARAWGQAVHSFVAVRASGVSLIPSSSGGEETGSSDSPAQMTEKVASLEKEIQDLREESVQNRQTVTEVRDNVSQILKETAQQKTDEDAKAQDYLSGIVRLDEAVRKLGSAWQKSGATSAPGISTTTTQSIQSTNVPTGGSSAVNLNTATAAELDSLPGIGPAYAQRILDYRQQHGPYKDVRDLLNVEGIGNATLDKIKDLLTL